MVILWTSDELESEDWGLKDESTHTCDNPLLQSSLGTRYRKIQTLQNGFQLCVDQAFYLRDHSLWIWRPRGGHRDFQHLGYRVSDVSLRGCFRTL